MNDGGMIKFNDIAFSIERMQEFFPKFLIPDLHQLKGCEFCFSDETIREYIPMAREFLDYVEKRNGLVNAVTLADVKRVAERLLKDQPLLFTVTGRPVGVTASR